MEVFHLIEKVIAGSVWKLKLVYFSFKLNIFFFFKQIVTKQWKYTT